MLMFVLMTAGSATRTLKHLRALPFAKTPNPAFEPEMSARALIEQQETEFMRSLRKLSPRMSSTMSVTNTVQRR
jgi:hypothetical protein